jgi:hypothetical protein
MKDVLSLNFFFGSMRALCVVRSRPVHAPRSTYGARPSYDRKSPTLKWPAVALCVDAAANRSRVS